MTQPPNPDLNWGERFLVWLIRGWLRVAAFLAKEGLL